MSFKPMDPYRGEEPQAMHGADLEALVAFYKETADENGEPYDPAWDEWIAQNRAGTLPIDRR